MQQFLFTYGGSLATGFLVTLFLLAVLVFVERRWGVGKKAVHHTHTNVSRFGGLALIPGFLFALWLSPIPSFPTSWWVFFGVLGGILVIGLWDDLRNMSWKYQLLAQLSILLILYFGGVHITSLSYPDGTVHFTSGALALAGLIIFLMWGSLVLNSINWLDGIDGLCGSVMAIAFSTLFFLSLSPAVYQPAVAILLAVTIGGTVAFLLYNYPPAQIIGGTSGALFFGIIAVFVSVVAGTKIATTLLVLALPIVDTFFVLVKRILQKRSLFQPDREHLHHLLQKKGWSDKQIVLTYAALTLGIGVLALTTQALGKFTAIIFVFALLGIILSSFHFQWSLSKKWGVATGLLFGIFVFCFLIWNQYHDRHIQNAWIGDHWYALEVAETPEEKTRGLSEREHLCLHCGMVFIFHEPVTPSFWMKDMRFSIDILWVLDDRVVAKHENLPHPSLETFRPQTPVTKVIELPAGAAHDIPIGAKIYFW